MVRVEPLAMAMRRMVFLTLNSSPSLIWVRLLIFQVTTCAAHRTWKIAFVGCKPVRVSDFQVTTCAAPRTRKIAFVGCKPVRVLIFQVQSYRDFFVSAIVFSLFCVLIVLKILLFLDISVSYARFYGGEFKVRWFDSSIFFTHTLCVSLFFHISTSIINN